jgi:uncharacterized RDD family membrane protein YckC
MTVTAAPILRFGGFWSRVVASVIDGFVLGMVFGAISAATGRDLFNTDVVNFDWLAYLASLAIGWLYEASLTASPRGATLGKMATGLRVVDAAGQTVSFGRANARYLAKLLSASIFCIGFLMVAFTERKRGLHDMIAGTLVIKTD